MGFERKLGMEKCSYTEGKASKVDMTKKRGYKIWVGMENSETKNVKKGDNREKFQTMNETRWKTAFIEIEKWEWKK